MTPRNYRFISKAPIIEVSTTNGYPIPNNQFYITFQFDIRRSLYTVIAPNWGAASLYLRRCWLITFIQGGKANWQYGVLALVESIWPTPQLGMLFMPTNLHIYFIAVSNLHIHFEYLLCIFTSLDFPATVLHNQNVQMRNTCGKRTRE